LPQSLRKVKPASTSCNATNAAKILHNLMTARHVTLCNLCRSKIVGQIARQVAQCKSALWF
jgi:hypothetical protein